MKITDELKDSLSHELTIDHDGKIMSMNKSLKKYIRFHKNDCNNTSQAARVHHSVLTLKKKTKNIRKYFKTYIGSLSDSSQISQTVRY